MKKLDLNRYTDSIVVAIANLFNIIMVAVFLFRTIQIGHIEVIGFIWMAFIVALSVALIQNIKAKRGWWFFVLPALLGIFLIVEVVLDYITKYDFRNSILMGPYLLLYYISILGMVGYSFLVKKKYGFITLTTYFLSQFAALYSYLFVGHG